MKLVRLSTKTQIKQCIRIPPGLPNYCDALICKVAGTKLDLVPLQLETPTLDVSNYSTAERAVSIYL